MFSNLKRKRKFGFLSRKQYSPSILRRRRAVGRKVLCA